WKSERDIDRLLKGNQLERDVPLIMIHRHDTIIGTVNSSLEQGVGGGRAIGSNRLLPCVLDSRSNDPGLFIAKESLFSRMRIQGTDPKSGRGTPNPTQKPVHESDFLFDICCREQARDTGDRCV